MLDPSSGSVAGYRPLAGIRIVEWGDSVSMAFAGRILSWLGATVTKVAEEGGLRTGSIDADADKTFVEEYCDTGKEIALVSDAAAHVRASLDTADILLTDRSPGTLTAAGLDPHTWNTERPHTILGSITGYGLTGPHRERGWSELTSYHAGGEGFLLPGSPTYDQFPDRAPLRGGRYLAEYDAGLAAAIGIVGALVGRQRAGLGDVVEISAQEVEIGLNRTTLSRAFFQSIDLDRGDRGYDYGGILRAADGWVSIRPTEDGQWRSFAQAIGRPDLAEDPRFATRAGRDAHGDELTAEIKGWVASRTRAEIRALVIEAGCPGGAFLSPAEVLDDAALADRDLFAPYGEGRAPGRAFRVHARGPKPIDHAPDAARAERSADRPHRGPLSGYRVLDLCWVAAGPYATELLAFMGADVIKVESRDRPDLFRRLLAASPDELDSSIRFVDINQEKRSLELNLKNPEDRETLLELARDSDLLVENFRPGVRDRLGIGDEALRAVNASIVTTNLTGFGQTGPMKNRPGYASVFNAEAGVGYLTGYADAAPTEIRDSNDLRAGMAACLASLVGLYEANNGDGAPSMDVAAREALIALQGDAMLEASVGGTPERSGNALPGFAPYDCYSSADGLWVAVSVRNRRERAGLVQVIPAVDALLAGAASDDALDERISETVAAWIGERTADDVVELLNAVGVPAAVSAPASRILNDPHLRERGFFRTWTHSRLGEIELIGSPIRFWQHPQSAAPSGSPLLGEHTDEVLESRSQPVTTP